MAYVKTVWETGDVITAEKLNNMEDGISRFEVVDAVPNEDEDYEIQMSFADLKALTDAGKIVFVSFASPAGSGMVLAVESRESVHTVYVSSYLTSGAGASPSVITFEAATVDDNPVEV